MPESAQSVDVLIIGAGLSGIGAGYHLQTKCPKWTYTSNHRKFDGHADARFLSKGVPKGEPMKLFFAPGSCSRSAHIVLNELGIPFEAERMDGRTHKTASGVDFYTINPKGQVPTLLLDDGQVLTEGAVIIQYLADRKPEARLAPPAGTMERYRLQEWLNFIATELHKTMSPLFNPKLNDEVRQVYKDRISKRIDFVAQQLEKTPYLMGQSFTVADAYLFTILGWHSRVDIDLAKWPSVTAFMNRMNARPAVRAVLEVEAASQKSAA
jgi:glutathione S-transferase